MESKRALALRLGASHALAPGEAIPERAFSACFDIVCNQSTVTAAMVACASGGTIVMVGTAHGHPEFDLPRLQRYEVTLKGSSIFMDADMESALQLLKKGAFDAQALISRTKPITEVVGAYADAGRPDNIKTLIELQDY